MTYRDFTAKLRRLGCEFKRNGADSHRIRFNPATRGLTSIPDKGTRDLPIGTRRRVLNQLGISRQEFNRA
ncbi:MAG: type II toxin-antitoxin system HicA family toxin [Chloroflexi bacterium]|nr:type II toxin-antitoxin system HicA family toxin [Chloroflexota bacterium]